MLRFTRMTCIPPNKDGDFVTKAIHVIVTSCRPPELATGLIRPIKTWSALETHQEKSSEVIIRVLEHGRLHVGSGRASVLNIMITIAISHGRPRNCD